MFLFSKHIHTRSTRAFSIALFVAPHSFFVLFVKDEGMHGMHKVKPLQRSLKAEGCRQGLLCPPCASRGREHPASLIPPLCTFPCGQMSRAVLLQTFPSPLCKALPHSILAPPTEATSFPFLVVIPTDAFLCCPPFLLLCWTKAGETKRPSQAGLIGFGNTAGSVSLILSPV